MKLKGFLYVIVGFAVLIFLISLLMPSSVITSRSVTINAQPDSIMAQISDLNNWKNWHPFFKDNKSVSQVGDTLKWDNNKLYILGVGKNDVKIYIQNGNGRPDLNILKVSSGDPSTTVEWNGINYLKWYPWEKFSGIFLNSVVGPSYEKALAGLKNYLEK